jgi:tRNA threonylcarbamoyladenosine biosynthesis protein TsaE
VASIELTTESAPETERAAAVVSRGLRAGDVVFVAGEVGTGKTTFVRGACKGLGIRENVISPSFTIGRVYEGALPVSHIDLFRLDTLEGEDPSLLADYLAPGSVVFIEWPETAAPELEPERVALRVSLMHLGGDRRRLRMVGRKDLVERIESTIERTN